MLIKHPFCFHVYNLCLSLSQFKSENGFRRNSFFELLFEWKHFTNQIILRVSFNSITSHKYIINDSPKVIFTMKTSIFNHNNRGFYLLNAPIIWNYLKRHQRFHNVSLFAMKSSVQQIHIEMKEIKLLLWGIS